ncbi:F-box-like/WD repeat-containing protein TBL1Y [Erysiphe neolycopersici]|uniref:F-box-like/WD repeat-containing protein TBL1Y n=1 Tax=Erysiphe neolycopersici TaxID=212602 RepID=A0A420HDC8_9PEZI|nr:F-box-like/WD repeat-containing protein TBL1Y [Erysiphe neolycopersici]
MGKEKLDSDKVNYMIWRYLIELDYFETAVRLQKEWNIKDPQELPFAPHVRPHALVSILNRGLIYNMHERIFATQVSKRNDGILTPININIKEQYVSSTDINTDENAATVGFFGPMTPLSPLDNNDPLAARKHSIENDSALEIIPPPPKKQRCTNIYDNIQTIEENSCNIIQSKLNNTGHKNSIDEGQINDKNEQAYPSPEPMPTPHTVTATSGHDKGIQVEKVHDLTPETIYLELSENPQIKGIILAQCAFHPRDSNILAAAGSDALARIWSLKSLQSSSVKSANESPGMPIYAPHRKLYDFSVSLTTQATALSWAPEGNYLAIASQPSDTGLARVDFWSEDASLVSSNFGIESPVVNIKWNPSGTACLILSPQNDNTDSSITVIYPILEITIRFTLQSHNLAEQLLEVLWTSNDDFIVCGGNLLQAFLCSAKTKTIVPGKKYKVPEEAGLSQVVYDFHTQLLVTATDTGMIYIWNKDGQSRVFTAHQGLITQLTWQPLVLVDPLSKITERLLASAGEDGAISIWNVLLHDVKSRASMTMRSAASAIAFSPDGIFLASATSENVFIWKTDSPHIPLATWTCQYESGWETPLSSESTLGEEEICCLSWDSEGRRLAYGINNRLALINFRP